MVIWNISTKISLVFPKRVEETDIELMTLDNIGSTALQKWCEQEGCVTMWVTPFKK